MPETQIMGMVLLIIKGGINTNSLMMNFNMVMVTKIS